MSCLYPTKIPSPKFKPNKKNGGIPPIPIDPRELYIEIPCGECGPCRKSDAKEWQIRLQEHTKEHKNGKFVLLTISDEWFLKLDREIHPSFKGYDRENEIAKLAKRRFKDRYIKETGKNLHCWLVTELGPNKSERLHLHGIIWTDESKATITRLWKYGYTGRGRTWKEAGNYVSGRTMNYITKYLFKTDLKHPNYKPIILCSQGIGKAYTKTSKFQEHAYRGEDTRNYYRLESGHKTTLPRYYKEKIWTDEEKQLLHIQNMDKHTNYIGNQKFDMNTETGRKNYLAARTEARKDSKKLGYGSPYKNLEQIDYENELRDKRLKNLRQRWQDNLIFRETRAFRREDEQLSIAKTTAELK